MTEIQTFATFLEYRGGRLRYRSGGDTWVRVDVDGEPTLERFPDALEMGSDPGDPWVMLPKSVFDAVYRREVFGRWNGVRVAVESIVRRGLRRGSAVIRYEGILPAEAIAAGLTGSQNDGWTALVDPSEVEDVTVTETMFPMARS
ncbi:hypothetical protein IF188_10895 [Microbacterium sp. NEAU-LLC]|uniref:Uncharacterized protein n=1 Tax=Microbacterium helvum TaxID=2773713 RepID=A0ABR8NR16_9MICO|nr:hypothetical protein [Microbacterium helvum]MBD3942202.1 hypothetical protein [Microbacterium helvum]